MNKIVTPRSLLNPAVAKVTVRRPGAINAMVRKPKVVVPGPSSGGGGGPPYVHPNHTGDVTSIGDGATTLQATAPVIVDLDMRLDALETVPPGSYVHPDHTGDVTSDGDGATTLQSTAPVIVDLDTRLEAIEGLPPPVAYVHPDHTGDVTSNGDGVTTLQPTAPVIVDLDARLDALEAAPPGSYVHPDHTGDVTSDGDGATVLQAAAPVIVDLDARLDAMEAASIVFDGRLDTEEAASIVFDGRLDAVEAANTAQDTAIDGKVDDTGDTMTGPLQVPAGTVSAPGLQVGAANDGIYQVSAGSLGFTFGGVQGFRANQYGVGIGGDATTTEGLYLYKSGQAFITVESDTAASLRSTSYINSTVGAVFNGRKARGTKAAPALPILGDNTVTLRGAGWLSGTTFQTTGEIRLALSEPTPTASAQGAQWLFSANALGTINNAEIARLDHATGLSMYGANPVIDANRHHRLRSYTMAEVALLNVSPAGQEIYVSDETGGGTEAFSDGVNWRRVHDRGVSGTAAGGAVFTQTTDGLAPKTVAAPDATKFLNSAGGWTVPAGAGTGVANAYSNIKFGPGGADTISASGADTVYVTSTGSTINRSGAAGAPDTLNLDVNTTLIAARTWVSDGYSPIDHTHTEYALTGHTHTTLAALAINAGELTVDRVGDAVDAVFGMNVDNNKGGYTYWRTGTSTRWTMGKDNSIESGSNVGSNFNFSAWNDAGGVIGAAFQITRASRIVNFPVSPISVTPAINDPNPLKLATIGFVTANFQPAGSYSLVGHTHPEYALATALAGYQPLDTELTTLASSSAFFLDMSNEVDAPAMRTKLGLGSAATHAHGDYQPAGSYQPLDTELTTLAGSSAFFLDMSNEVDAPAMRTKLGLGTVATHAHSEYQPAGSYQPLDADLTALAGSSAFFLDMSNEIDASAMRAKLGLGTVATHAHTEYALTGHTHSEYSLTSHTHSQYAPIASPIFTGNPTAPTRVVGDDDASIATTAFVQSAIAAIPAPPAAAYRGYKVLSDYPAVLNDGSVGDAVNVAAMLKDVLKYNRTLLIHQPIRLGAPIAITIETGFDMAGCITGWGPEQSYFVIEHAAGIPILIDKVGTGSKKTVINNIGFVTKANNHYEHLKIIEDPPNAKPPDHNEIHMWNVEFSFEKGTTWAASTVYALGANVTYSNRQYYCTTPHTSTASFDITKWDPLWRKWGIVLSGVNRPFFQNVDINGCVPDTTTGADDTFYGTGGFCFWNSFGPKIEHCRAASCGEQAFLQGWDAGQHPEGGTFLNCGSPSSKIGIRHICKGSEPGWSVFGFNGNSRDFNIVFEPMESRGKVISAAAAVGTTAIEFTTSVVHGWVTGDNVWFDGGMAGGGFTALREKRYTITKTANNKFTIAVNGSTWGAYTASSGTGFVCGYQNYEKIIVAATGTGGVSRGTICDSSLFIFGDNDRSDGLHGVANPVDIRFIDYSCDSMQIYDNFFLGANPATFRLIRRHIQIGSVYNSVDPSAEGWMINDNFFKGDSQYCIHSLNSGLATTISGNYKKPTVTAGAAAYIRVDGVNYATETAFNAAWAK